MAGSEFLPSDITETFGGLKFILICIRFNKWWDLNACVRCLNEYALNADSLYPLKGTFSLEILVSYNALVSQRYSLFGILRYVYHILTLKMYLGKNIL